jgi:hypothetical protein
LAGSFEYGVSIVTPIVEVAAATIADELAVETVVLVAEGRLKDPKDDMAGAALPEDAE